MQFAGYLIQEAITQTHVPIRDQVILELLIIAGQPNPHPQEILIVHQILVAAPQEVTAEVLRPGFLENNY